MKKRSIVYFIITALFVLSASHIVAQTASTSDNMVAQPIPDETVLFDYNGEGDAYPIIWGLDLAWLDAANIRRGIEYMGSDIIDVVRSSFMPTDTIIDGQLTGDALTNTTLRINIINTYLPEKTKVVLNCDPTSIHASMDPSNANQAENWANLIDITRQMHVDSGRTVIAVSPFNEPDYSYTGQGTNDDFYAIIEKLKTNANFDDIRISGGNTLNDDVALEWYNYLKPAGLTEGNTHQLAGDFDHYAAFFEAVRDSGDHATADELHNVMEAMVGVEYGMQTGIWWGTAEYARGEFCKASDGVRLGYAENRSNWSAASVYKAPDGKIQAFTGGSERQAVTTSFRFVSRDEPVFYDGYGPMHEFVIENPGGNGYQVDQPNAERVINITTGDDIQPVIDGQYIIVNRNSEKVMTVTDGSTTAGANICQLSYETTDQQHWNVEPVDSRIGGDFSYFTITAQHSGMSVDVYNWSLEDGGNIEQWDAAFGNNQQWLLEYIEDGWFYIRSRHSGKCLEVADSDQSDEANIQQSEKTGESNQQWRLIPVGQSVEFSAPTAPSNLTATSMAESIRLDWDASSDTDVAGYIIYRSKSSGGSYFTIARDVTTTSFVDNSALTGTTYYYTVKAMDNSLNRSEYSNEVSGTPTGEDALVAQYKFEDDLQDNSQNLNNAVFYGTETYVEGQIDSKAISLDGDSSFIKLPSTIANHEEISISTWVYWLGGESWERIFDFGNSQSQNMFLTPSTNTSLLRFAIKDGGDEQTLNATALSTGEWSHIAITLGESGAKMYVNGVLVDESTSFTINPMDFKPVLNYIGRSQYSDPLFEGYIDEFKVYNYVLTQDEITQISLKQSTAIQTESKNSLQGISFWPNPADNKLNINIGSEDLDNGSISVKIINLDGMVIKNLTINNTGTNDVYVNDINSGVYILNLSNNSETYTKKIVIKH